MRLNLLRRRYLMLWQLLLLVFGTTWIWAPLLNPALADKINLISEYETPHQPYSWLFRTGDALAGLLIFGLAWLLVRHHQKAAGWLMFAAGAGWFIDPLLPTTCHMSGGNCVSYFSLRSLFHSIESVSTGVIVFALVVYDALNRKKLLSWLFVLGQLAYGVYFLSRAVNGMHTSTILEYSYDASIIAWLAWYGRDILALSVFEPRQSEIKIVKNLAAAWAYANGIFAIILSLAHIQLVGRLQGLYFPGDNAWLAQHGVIIGVVLLYLGRHLARGERRARQIFLLIAGMEVLKYSVITPSFGLLALYSLTFVALFIFRDDFDRGTVPLTWTIRLKDLYYMAGGLIIAVGAAILILDRDDTGSMVVSRTYSHFTDYVSRGGLGGHSHVRAVLLAHTASAFLAAAAASILWILFRPAKIGGKKAQDYKRAEDLLRKLSDSSEDYFKLWPRDKNYLWQKQPEGFTAYKIAGAGAFALADPISPDKQAAVGEFIEWARGRRLKACFMPVYPGSQALYEKAGLQLIQIGASAVIDIKKFIAETSNDKWWRWQKNRAAKGGYEFFESAPPHPGKLMRELKIVSNGWLQVGGHAEYGFALGHFDEDYLNKCHLYYLKDSDGKVIAFTNKIPQFNQGDIVTVDMLRYLPRFNNAMQFLLYKTIEAVASDGAGYKSFDLGFVPFAKAKGPILAIARTLGGSRFSARGLEQFKNKFDPVWQPNYLAYDGDLADLATIALYLEQAMDLK